MKAQTPVVFISATTADLAKAREVAKEALLEVGCRPEVQKHFDTTAGEIVAGLTEKIENSDAVIHIVGKAFGAAPPDGSPVRSYTQQEYDVACRLKKPIYIFFANDTFYSDSANLPDQAPVPESDEKRELQREHYDNLRAGRDIWYDFSSLDELRNKILRIRERDRQWARIITRDRRNYLWIAAAIFVLLAAIAFGLWRMHGANSAAQQKSEQDNSENKQLLLAIKQKIENPTDLPPGLQGDQLYEWVISSTAKQEGISVDEAKKRLSAFVTKVDSTQSSSEEDRALSNFARKFVLRGFRPDEFDKYVQTLSFSKWKPEFFVLHNTNTPNLAQRPNGFSERELRNLAGYLVQDRKWNGGPHLYVDQKQIWVFNALTEPGIHARGWNKESIGVEMLGDYNQEPLDPQVRDNTVAAIATLCRVLKIDGTQIRLHRDSPGAGGKDCPGRNVTAAEFIERVVNTLRSK